MTVGVVTDSSCDLDSTALDGLGVEVVPLYIRFGDEELLDREELTVADFYRRMASSEALPQTAAPSPGRFEQAFRRLLDAGSEAVVCINLSADISATMQAAVQGAEAVRSSVGASADIRVIDSRSVAAGLGTLVLQAARSAADGAGADDVEALVVDASARTHVFGTLNTLENLRKGGRIGGAQAMLGSMLGIKPIVDFSSGRVEEAAKVRTRRKALLWMRDKLASVGGIESLTMMQGAADDAEAFRAMLTESHGPELRVCDVGPVVGTHAGAGVIGVSYQVPRTAATS